MKCPVCPCTDIDALADRCPNCGQDLGLIKMIGRLAPVLYDEGLSLARQGDFQGAMVKTSGAIALDGGLIPARILLAKILWRLGWRDGAISQLRQAEGLGAGEKAQPLLDAALKERPARSRNMIFVFAACMALACLGVAGITIRQMSVSRSEANEAAKALTELQIKYDISRTRLDELQAALSNQRAAQPDDTAGPGTLDTLLQALAGSEGLAMEIQGDALVVKFSDGLYPFGSAIPTPAGCQALASLGTILSAHRFPLLVVIEGHTDNTSPRDRAKSSNEILGLARAKAAYEAMGPEVAQKADVRFLLYSQGQADPPFPNDSRENRLKNCTVVVRLIATGDAGRAGPAATNPN